MKNLSKRHQLRLALFVLLALIQFSVPAWMIVAREQVLSQGELFKFKTAPVDPYDFFRGRYVALDVLPSSTKLNDPKLELRPGQWVFVGLSQDAQGFAQLGELSLQAPEEPYLRLKVAYVSHPSSDQVSEQFVELDLPFDRYYMAETLAPEAERAYMQLSVEAQTYIEVRVKGGRGVLAELYLARQPVYEYLLNPPPPKDPEPPPAD